MPLNIMLSTTTDEQVRWIETSIGPMYIQRRWFTSIPEVSIDWLDLRSEYALMFSIPHADGRTGSTRIEMTWVDISFGEIPISEELALMLGIEAIKTNITNLDNKEIEPE